MQPILPVRSPLVVITSSNLCLPLPPWHRPECSEEYHSNSAHPSVRSLRQRPLFCAPCSAEWYRRWCRDRRRGSSSICRDGWTSTRRGRGRRTGPEIAVVASLEDIDHIYCFEYIEENSWASISKRNRSGYTYQSTTWRWSAARHTSPTPSHRHSGAFKRREATSASWSPGSTSPAPLCSTTKGRISTASQPQRMAGRSSSCRWGRACCSASTSTTKKVSRD